VVYPIASIKQLPRPRLPGDHPWLAQGLSGLKQPVVHSLRQQNPYLWGLGLGSFTLGLVNGALVISAGIGLVAYQQFLALSPAQWQTWKQKLQQTLPLPKTTRQQALVFSVGAWASTYTLTALWHNTHSLLLALILTGQSALMLFVVAALLRSNDARFPAPGAVNSQPPAPQSEPIYAFEQRLEQLSHSDPLQRLVAVRQLLRLAAVAQQEVGVGVSARSHLIDCFHLMLAHEPEPIVRSAVREGLAQLRQSPQLPEGPAPLPEAAAQAPAERQCQRATVDYVEYLDL